MDFVLYLYYCFVNPDAHHSHHKFSSSTLLSLFICTLHYFILILMFTKQEIKLNLLKMYIRNEKSAQKVQTD